MSISVKKQYKRRFIENDLDPYVQKLNKNRTTREHLLEKQGQINKISQRALETQKQIIKELYELMPLRAKIKFHDKFGGECLIDIYERLDSEDRKNNNL